jgi:drug/metabolite transporter (DMT)-like permease
MNNPSVRVRLALGLAVAITLDTCTQILWKVSAAKVPDGVSLVDTMGAMLDQPLFVVFGVLMVLKLINWLMVLDIADVSYAKPITSLSYVTVAIASFAVLHERLHWLQIIGILTIIAGVWCISYPDLVNDRNPTAPS